MLDHDSQTTPPKLATEAMLPQILRKGSGDSEIRLAMLGCEDNPPYGPTEHTAKLFLELVSETLAECSPDTAYSVCIDIYRAKIGHYPSQWDLYNGFIIPGSLSAAYDNEPWIEKLKHVIQTEIVAHQRKTIAICFGHQVLAHSFDDGKANKHCHGSRGGRFSMATTEAGASILGGKQNIHLYYTHGDMVEKLPSCAVALGDEGTDLPIQAAAYYGDNNTVEPYAITFQAHPEYAVSPELGIELTLCKILDILAEKDLLTKESVEAAKGDAIEHFDEVHRSSKDAFIASARALGWFPKK